MTTQVLREEWTKAERKAAGLADDDADQLRSGYVFGWAFLCLALSILPFGYWLGGLAFLTILTHAALVGAVVYVSIRMYREWKRDRAFWAAVREYLNRHAG